MVRQEIKCFRMDHGDYKGLECTAPCSLYSVLLGNKCIADPTVSDNAASLGKYSDRGCTFYADFEVTPLILSMKNVILRFHGLDTLCRVEINGQTVGETDNMHLTYDFDVKTKLNVGNNELRLVFSAPKESDQLRKAYYTFGSEGTPRLPDMGIFRKIEIVAFNHKIISNVKIRQTHSENSVRLDMSIDTYGHDEASRAVATLTSPAGNVYFCGFVGGEGSITVTDPNLWWPNGIGMQNLYRLNVNLYSDSQIEDTYEMSVGLRTFSLAMGAGTPTLLINGSPMLAMGGEYMPEDILTSRLSEEKTRALLEDAKKANFNSIFIHGMGYYPEKYFFDACDELGLAVFMHLPVKESFTASSPDLRDEVKKEIYDNITRVTQHPSLAVVIGNAGVMGLFDEGEADDFAKSLSDFDGMNVVDLTGECCEHLAYVGHTSLPTYKSITRFAEPERRNLGSLVFELHGADTSTVADMLSRAFGLYPYANGMNELSYVMGLSSAELSMQEVDALRRSKDRPLGIVMRRMNDSWPSLSPSAIDYYGGKKPLHYYERDFFAPVRISAVRNGTRVKFIVSNDMRQDYVGVFTYQIMNGKNQPVFRDSFPIRARASSNLEVHNADIGSVISGHETEYYLLYSVADKCNEVSKSTLLFTNIKRFEFLKPNYSVDISGTGMEYVLTVSSDCFVKGVEITFSDEDVQIDKNYFDITGRSPIRIRLSAKRMTSIEKLKRVMNIRAVRDLGHEQ